ncbi:MAG: gliding motility-associated C-terminal domain-containing protein [Bacteroidales bacterium]|nr:gliding motility-associated C-terminal domain-containing protein [Bacteroidales bacterium]
MASIKLTGTFFRISLVCTLIFFFSHYASSQSGFYINETFRGDTSTVITFGGSPIQAYLTSSHIDPVGDGWLRLTSDEQNQKGFAIVNQPFSSTNGVLIDMEFVIWRTHPDGFGGADGFSIFLYDAAVSNFSMGGFGGSLGYAQRTIEGVPEHGLIGGFVGIGFDEYGNYSNFSEARDGGLGFGRTPNTIGIRGPGDKASNWFNGYSWLTGNSSLGFDLQAGQTNARPSDTSHYRRVQLEITPLPDKQYSITVRMMTQKNGTFTTVLPAYTLPTLPPAMLKLGLAASTGQSINVHEIRNLIITSAGGIRARKSVDKTFAKVGDELNYSIDVFNQTDQQATGLILRDTLSKIASNFQVTGITFDNHGDVNNTATNYTNTDLSNVTLNISPISYVTFNIKGKIKNYPVGGILTNSVTVEMGSSTIIDPDFVNNTSFASTEVEMANAPDFIITQSVNDICLNPSITNTLSLHISNIGKTASVLNSVVTVKDTIPTGLKVIGIPGGTGWMTTNVGNAYKFTRSDVIAKNTSFPDINISVEQVGSTPNISWVNIARVDNDSDFVKGNNETSPMILYAPISVNAGADQTVYSSGIVTLAGSTSSGLTGAWSVVSGIATFDDITKPNAKATLAPNTTATLKWTLSNSSCSSSDEVIISYFIPKVTLIKSVSNPQTFKLGSTINYSFKVANAGLVTLSDVLLADNKLTNQPIYVSGDLNVNSKLDIGETWTYSASYVVKQADVDAGQVTNSAVVTAKDPSLNVVTDTSGSNATNDSETITPIEHINNVVLTKTVTTVGPYRLGDKIDYSFSVANEGTTTLSDVVLTDPKLSVAPLFIDGDSNTNNKLDVGETWTYIGHYTVKQSDVDFGKVSNIATIHSLDQNGVDVSDISGSNVPTVAYLGEGKITLVKEVDTLITKKPFVLNDSIIYKFTVKNIGVIPLNTLVLTDLKFSLSSPPIYLSGDLNNNKALDLTETWIYKGKYYVSQADVDAGKVVNSALITSRYNNGIEEKAASDSSGTKSNTDDPTITPILQTTSVALVKVITNDASFKLGDQIIYQFTVKNTGTTTLSDVVITDLKLDGSVVFVSGDNNSNGKLDPKENWIYTGKHTIVQADVTAGIVQNSALVTVKDPDGKFITDISGTNDKNDIPTVATVNQKPVAIDDNAVTKQVTPVTIDVRDNDVPGSVEIDPKSIEIIAQPLNGIVTITIDGTIIYTPVKGFSGDDVFTYRVKDINGKWSNIAEVVVTVSPINLDIPNVFTPNGDGVNDTFAIGGLANFDNASLYIYNRWGAQVYADTNYRNDWTGYGLNEGTYFFVLFLKNGTKSNRYKGWVLLKR